MSQLVVVRRASMARSKSMRSRSPARYCASEISGCPVLSRRARSQVSGLSASLKAGFGVAEGVIGGVGMAYSLLTSRE